MSDNTGRPKKADIDIVWGVFHEELSKIMDKVSYIPNRHAAYMRAYYGSQDLKSLQNLRISCLKMVNAVESLIAAKTGKDSAILFDKAE